MAGKGRPTKYKKEYIAKIAEYLKTCVDEEFDWTKSTSDSSKGSSESWEHRIKVHLPSIEGFATYLNVDRNTIYNWADENKDFLRALEKIEVEQKKVVLAKGLSGDYNPTIAKLILSANHNMREKVDSDITSGGKPLNIMFDSVFEENEENN